MDMWDPDFLDFENEEEEELKLAFDKLLEEGGPVKEYKPLFPVSYPNEREYAPGVEFFKYHKDHTVILNSANNKPFWVCRQCMVEVKK